MISNGDTSSERLYWSVEMPNGQEAMIRVEDPDTARWVGHD
jgi:hypothetical protein